jgi:hypothetical protein
MSRYPDQEKALHQVQRNRYHHAHGPTAPKQAPGPTFEFLDGVSFRRLQESYETHMRRTFNMSVENVFMQGSGPVSLSKPFPVDRTRCEACGLLDDDCRCTWTSP